MLYENVVRHKVCEGFRLGALGKDEGWGWN
jgi:hypothetical protein